MLCYNSEQSKVYKFVAHTACISPSHKSQSRSTVLAIRPFLLAITLGPLLSEPKYSTHQNGAWNMESICLLRRLACIS